MADPPSFETPLVRVPYESLRRTARDRKQVVDGLAAAASELDACASGQGDDARAATSPSAAADALSAVATRLAALKRKFDAASDSEAADACRCVARLRHLVDGGGPLPPRGSRAPGEVASEGEQGAGPAPPDKAATPAPPSDPSAPASAVAWTARRLDRLVADDLLRRGRERAAAALLDECGPAVRSCVDEGVWAAAGPALAGLAARDAGPALAWCAAHAGRLAKLKSPLEFRLRLQQCVEMVRAGDGLGALAHARTHLAPWAAGTKGGGGSSFLTDLQRAAGLAAFCGRAGGGGGSAALPRPYAALLDDARWEDAAAALRRDVCRLAGAPVGRSALETAVQAGLAALKPPPGAPPPSSADDPLSDPSLSSLAGPLPHAKRLHSRLVCGLTGRLMDGDNPPAALPSGAVYGEPALRARAAGGPTLTDPETGERVRVSDLRRVYIS